MAKKDKTLPEFDESFLIGSISGLNKSAKPQEASEEKEGNALLEAEAQLKDKEPVQSPEPELQLENKAEDQPLAEDSPQDQKGNNSKGEKKSNSSLSPKTKAGKGWEYERFLTPTPGRKDARAYISDSKHQKIKKLLALSDSKVAIADYLENVLDEHFERYDQQVKELYRKLLEE